MTGGAAPLSSAVNAIISDFSLVSADQSASMRGLPFTAIAGAPAFALGRTLSESSES